MLEERNVRHDVVALLLLAAIIFAFSRCTRPAART